MKKQSKTERIRVMLYNGEDAATIAKKVKVSKSYVYTIKAKEAKKQRITERIERAEARVAELPPAPLDVQIGGDHYKDMAIQPVQFIVANNLGFLEGCIIKRICRWKVKGGVEDLQKLKHEVDLLIDLMD